MLPDVGWRKKAHLPFENAAELPFVVELHFDIPDNERAKLFAVDCLTYVCDSVKLYGTLALGV